MRTIARITLPRASTGRRIWVCTIGKAFETFWSSATAQMIFLPPLGAPKRHLMTHHCIEITNNKRRTARSRCHRRRWCCGSCHACRGCGGSGSGASGGCRRCRRRHNLAVSDSAALIGGGRVLEKAPVYEVPSKPTRTMPAFVSLVTRTFPPNPARSLVVNFVMLFKL